MRALGRTQDSQTGRLSASEWVALSAVLISSVSVRLWQPTGWLGSDDAGYYSAAEHILTGAPIERVHHQYSRLAMILPVAASVAIGGHTPVAVWLPTLLASLACIVVVFLLGRELAARRSSDCLTSAQTPRATWVVGALAALSVSLLPYFRVLSTAAYPDVHACLWSSLAVLLALRAAGANCGFGARGVDLPAVRRAAVALPLACGICSGLAVSAKLFAAPVAVAVAVALLLPIAADRRWRRRVGSLALVALGGAAFLLIEGTFYHFAAGDFLYTLHAHSRATDLEVTGGAAESFSAMAYERLSELLRASTSGWGTLGLTFWPVMMAALFVARLRVLAVWGLATYLGVAFMPVDFENGLKINPVFHGRHILTACIPFVVCLAWFLYRAADCIANRLTSTSDRQHVAAPAIVPVGSGRKALIMHSCLVGLIVGSALYDRHSLNGFCDRDMRRIGTAISQTVYSTAWDGDKPIFMAPSLYWRYRILFPLPLRERLRVAVEPSSPDWWRNVCPGIAKRAASLPGPDQAYLLATPRQLQGGTEHFDYDVSLPRDGLRSWQSRRPLAVAVRRGGPVVELIDAPTVENGIVALLGPETATKDQIPLAPSLARSGDGSPGSPGYP